MRFMVASSSRGISCERHIWVEKLDTAQTVQVVSETVRIAFKDTVVQDGWLLLPDSKGRVVLQILLQKLIIYIPGLSCENSNQGYLRLCCGDFHGQWQGTLCRLYLVIVWNRLLFGAFLRFVGKGSSQPLPSLKQSFCTLRGRIC